MCIVTAGKGLLEKELYQRVKRTWEKPLLFEIMEFLSRAKWSILAREVQLTLICPIFAAFIHGARVCASCWWF